MTDNVHITFIHGLANKPAPDDLRRIWLEALAKPVHGDEGFDPAAVGVSTSFVYWADFFYDTPLPAAEYESRANELEQAVATDLSPTPDDWLAAMRKHFPNDEIAYSEAPTDESTLGYERIPLPWFVKRRIMEHFLREAHDYLFNVNGIRDTIRNRVLDSVPASSRCVLVGHSQGSFIAYDVLNCVAACPQMTGLLTLGSPLGVDEIQDRLNWSRDNGFPGKLQGDWVNVYDPFDMVARFDPRLANDFRKNGQEMVIDVEEENWGTWRHSATKYLQGVLLRQHLRRLCGREIA
jgi:hypothetical protein